MEVLHADAVAEARTHVRIAAVPPYSDVSLTHGRATAGHYASFCWAAWMAAIIVLPVEPAGAESRSSTSCRSEPGDAGKVRAIADGRSFTLDDGREIRLAIEAPLLPGPGEAGTRATAALAARAMLESIIAGQNVELRQNDMPADRYGRTTAFVYVAGGPCPNR